MIPYGRQSISDSDIQAVIDVLKSDFLTQGPAVEIFEQELCRFTGAKNVIAVTNGTAALHLAVLALGIKPGQKVICPPLSFAASANCVLYCGGEVQFVDVDPKSMCLDPSSVEQTLEGAKEGEFAGIVTVDFAGHPSDLARLNQIAKKHGVWLLQDACHAIGGEIVTSSGSEKIGSGTLADAVVFSFHPVKHIATGEGGAICSNNTELSKKIRLLRTHGITKNPDELRQNDGPWYYEMQELGFNYRISDILCALGVSQLSRIHANVKRRNILAERYTSEFKGLPLEAPSVAPNVKHAWHLYVIRADNRLKFYNHLRANGISPQVHYVPIHKHPYYVGRYGHQTFLHAEKIYQRCLSLPMFHGLSDEDQCAVISAVKKFYA